MDVGNSVLEQFAPGLRAVPLEQSARAARCRGQRCERAALS
jgi:hypothetical protein